jgi:actin-related protein
MGFHEQVNESIMRLEYDMQSEMLPNIVLSGGNTLFDGLAGRLWNELTNM